MKNYVLIILLLTAVGFAISCSDDSEPDAHEIGAWELQTFAEINIDPNYNWFAQERSAEGAGFTSYVLTLNNDGSYVRRIERSGLSTLADQGTWLLDAGEEVLELVAEGEDDEETYKVEQNNLDLFKISLEVQDFAISNVDRDNLFVEFSNNIDSINAYLSDLSDEEINALFPAITYDVLLSFERVATTTTP